MHAFINGHCVVCLDQTLPSLVSVHGVVSAADYADLAESDLFHVLSQHVHVLFGASWRYVSSVQEAVHYQLLNALLFSQIYESKQVRDVAVDSAVREQALQMQRGAVLLDVLNCLQECFVFKEVPVLYCFCNHCQVLINDPARADVKVSDLGVAHLPLRQSYVKPAGLERRSRVFGEYLIQMRLVSRRDGVALLARVDPVPVQYHQHCRSSEICHVAPPCFLLVRLYHISRLLGVQKQPAVSRLLRIDDLGCLCLKSLQQVLSGKVDSSL